jgi:hypothetical protein
MGHLGVKQIGLAIICLILIAAVSGCLSATKQPSVYGNETEATEYQGIELTPISNQGNNAIKGTHYIDRDTYRLQIDLNIITNGEFFEKLRGRIE